MLSREEQLQLKRLDNKIKKWERRIEELEVELKEKTVILDETPYNESEEYKSLLAGFNATQKELEEAMATWENAELEKAELED